MFPIFTNNEYAAITVALRKQIEKLESTVHFYEDWERPKAEAILSNCKTALEKITGESNDGRTELLH